MGGAPIRMGLKWWPTYAPPRTRKRAQRRPRRQELPVFRRGDGAVFTGQRITLREGWRLRPHLYLFRCSARRLIDGAIDGSGAERINHGCEPNLVARFDHRRVFLLSLCPIAKGEELLFDYHVRGDIAPIPCRCGAPSCRGFLNAPDPS